MEADRPLTRKDLEPLLTRKEFHSTFDRVLDAKLELKFKEKLEPIHRAIGRLALDQIKIREIMATKDDFNEVKADLRKVLGAVDSLTLEVRTYRRESVSIPATLDQHGLQLRNHEARLSRLEGSPPSP